MKYMIAIFFIFFGLNSHADMPKMDFYGFLLANSTIAVNGVDSLGRNNLVAYNSASNPVLARNPSQSSSSFQVQQSRLGIKMQFEEDLETLFEIDFVDMSKSSPTVAALPRLRQAKITWHNEDWTFHAGQMWDLFSPLAPTTYNYIGHYFLSGDLGFMRLQAQALYQKDNWEHGMAVGFPSFNNQPQQSTPEFSMWPTLSVRESWQNKSWNYGASAIIGHLELSNNTRTQTPFAVNLFAQFKDSNDEMNFESYYGHNTENLSLQGLGYSANLLKLEEVGAFVTARRHLAEKHRVFYGFGYAKILNPENLDIAYTAGTTPVLNLTSATGSTGFGIVKNATARLGYEYLMRKRMTAFIETAFLYTEHKLNPTDQASHSSFRTAQVFETGFKVDL